jgi:hypothetical protein
MESKALNFTHSIFLIQKAIDEEYSNNFSFITCFKDTSA